MSFKHLIEFSLIIAVFLEIRIFGKCVCLPLHSEQELVKDAWFDQFVIII